MLLTVRLGPVAGASARAWLTSARATTAHLRDRPVLGVPPEVVDHFEGFLATWETAAATADPDEFRWDDEVDVDVVRVVAAHWVRVANLVRERPDLGLPRPDAAADAFYDALIIGIADVLARAEDTDYADSFSSVIPAFDAEAPTDAAPPAVRTYRVVLVDDTDDIRTLLRISFDLHAAFEVVGQARDGGEAIEVCREHQPDVVILDLRMPVMDGFTALPHLRRECPDAKVIVFSAETATEHRDRALELGAVGYLQKGQALPGLADEVVRILEAPPG